MEEITIGLKSTVSFSDAMTAAQEGKSSTIQRYLDERNSGNKKARKSLLTLLHIAAGMGHTEIVQRLIAGGIKINETNKIGETPLYLAAHNGHANVVKLLCSYRDVKGANTDLNKSLNNGTTPLHIAIQNKHFDVVNILIEYDVLINMKTSDGKTPLDFAYQADDLRIIELLLSRGATVGTDKSLDSRSCS